MHNLQWKIGLVSLFFLSACNQPAQVTPSSTAIDAKADLGSIYPHSDEFKKKTHGENFLQNATTCAKCHGKDFTGGNTEVSCQKCHIHPMGFANPQKHGMHYLNSTAEQKADCLKCHQGEQNSVAQNCADCHKAYPHKKRHGKIAQTPEAKCFACHKQETHPQVPNNKMCAECHEGTLKVYPDVEWVEPKPTEKTPEKTSSIKKTKRIPSGK